MTTAELLEALDSGVSDLCGKLQTLTRELDAVRRDAGLLDEPSNGAGPHPHGPDALRVYMQLAGLTNSEFSAVFGVAAVTIDGWLSGERPTPRWVIPSIQLLKHLPPASRTRLLEGGRPRTSGRKTTNSHPFSRIEEL